MVDCKESRTLGNTSPHKSTVSCRSHGWCSGVQEKPNELERVITEAFTSISVSCGTAEIHFPLALSEGWVTAGDSAPQQGSRLTRALPCGKQCWSSLLGSVKQAAKLGEIQISETLLSLSPITWFEWGHGEVLQHFGCEGSKEAEFPCCTVPKGYPVVQLRGVGGCGVLQYRDTAACGNALGVPRSDLDVPLVPDGCQNPDCRASQLSRSCTVTGFVLLELAGLSSGRCDLPCRKSMDKILA